MHLIDPNLDAQLAPWRRRADARIDARLADAKAHGRAGDLILAMVRLDELQGELAGSDGLIPEARAAFARQALAHHTANMDPEILRDDLGDGTDLASVARSAKIGGRDVARELASLLAVARAHLVSAHAAHGPGDPERAILRGAAFGAWHAQHKGTISRWAGGVLSDDQVALHNAIGHSLVRPELREEE